MIIVTYLPSPSPSPVSVSRCHAFTQELFAKWWEEAHHPYHQYKSSQSPSSTHTQQLVARSMGLITNAAYHGNAARGMGAGGGWRRGRHQKTNQPPPPHTHIHCTADDR